MGASGAVDAMNNLNLRGGPAPAFSLGDLAGGPTDWQRAPLNPIPDPVGQSLPRYMQVCRDVCGWVGGYGWVWVCVCIYIYICIYMYLYLCIYIFIYYMYV